MIQAAVDAFIRWLDRYGESSYDFQTFYAGPYGQRAKALYYRHRRVGILAVAPMVLCEALFPTARQWFWKPQRFPIADAHYCMAFARLFQCTTARSHYERAIHFLDVLLETACRGESGHGWGYPFDWVTIDGTIPRNTPLITTLPYVYEAFAAVHEIDGQDRWMTVMQSIAEHALRDYPDHPTGAGAACCSYSPLPNDRGRVVNASAYRGYLLTRAARDFASDEYARAAKPNIRFVLDSQNQDGSWYYAMDGRRNFIDHFHTCFVLKALIKIERLTGDPEYRRSVESGLRYYVGNLFDEQGLPRPFAKAPRLTVYRRELYDYAECLNLATLAAGRSARMEVLAGGVLNDLLTRWRKPDGSFRSRKLIFEWDTVPMHRWAQAQVFRSLCFLLSEPTAAQGGRPGT